MIALFSLSLSPKSHTKSKLKRLPALMGFKVDWDQRSRNWVSKLTGIKGQEIYKQARYYKVWKQVDHSQRLF